MKTVRIAFIFYVLNVLTYFFLISDDYGRLLHFYIGDGYKILLIYFNWIVLPLTILIASSGGKKEYGKKLALYIASSKFVIGFIFQSIYSYKIYSMYASNMGYNDHTLNNFSLYNYLWTLPGMFIGALITYIFTRILYRVMKDCIWQIDVVDKSIEQYTDDTGTKEVPSINEIIINKFNYFLKKKE